MTSTFLLHKPVIYGSALANSLFLGILLIHIITAAMAPIAAIVAFTAKKGRKIHQRSGHLFAISMIAVSLTGIVLDIIRLSFFVEENHTKYAGYTMPATYPARLGFLFIGLCTLYLLREVTPPNIFSRTVNKNATDLKIPSLLILTGFSLTAIIVSKFNPWTGALWMIWTFTLIVIIVAKTPPHKQSDGNALPKEERERDVTKHRIGTSYLAAFSWWGALQGFGPAIVIAIVGDDLSTTPYVGNQPGPFSLSFVFFFLAWAPFFAFAAYLIHRFTKLRQQS